MPNYLLGCDISHWNTVDWPTWAGNGYRFVYIKATEGITWVDGKWTEHRAAAEASDFYTGPYHYFRVQWDGVTQAQHFFDTVGKEWDMPPAIDIERTNNAGFSQAEFGKRLKTCLDKTEELFGRRPLIYTSRSAWQELVGAVSWASNYDLWVAHYTPAAQPTVPDAWVTKEWRFWQYTSTPLDQDRFNGELEDFLKWIGVVAPPPGGGNLEPRIQKLEEDVAALKALAERLHNAYHG